jgi:uncharacterized membrane protein YeaQ/YmgE (transglycosylase-associated protein family)
MNVVLWLIFGVIAGIIAHRADEEHAAGGIVGAILLGMFGAAGGGFIATMLFGQELFSFTLFPFVLAMVSCIFLLLIHRTVFIQPKLD